MTSLDSARLGDRPEPGAIRRRALLRSTVWTVPVIAAAAPAPAFAASPCATLPYQTGWAATSPATGTLTTGNGTNGYTSTYDPGGTNEYLSVADNANVATAARDTDSTYDATVTLSHSFSVTSGRTYTFSIVISSQYAGNNAATSGLQLLDITVGGTNIGKYTTHNRAPRSTGYTLLNTPASGIASQTVSVSYVATTTATVTFLYTWTLPSRRTSASATYTGNADIAVSAPTVTAC